MIKPSIGRVVLYNDGQSDQRVPGLVCYVHEEGEDKGKINIGGFRKDGTYFKAQKVHLCQGTEKCQIGQAEWMEYQKGQAEKAEAAEKALQEEKKSKAKS